MGRSGTLAPADRFLSRALVPLKVFIDVGDEESKNIALCQILVLVAKITPYCKQHILKHK